MRLKVSRKQENSRMCLVCGLENPSGLGASFLELDSGDLLALSTPRDPTEVELPEPKTAAPPMGEVGKQP